VDEPPISFEVVPSAEAGDVTPPEAAGIADAVVWALLDAAPDGLIVADEQGQMRLVNRRMEELFGYARGDLFGEPVETLLPEQSRDVHVAHRGGFNVAPHVRSMGSGLHLLGRRRDGSEFPVDISLSPLTTESRRWVIATVRDATDYRIARDLGDTVVRGLFGAGLRLQALQPRVSHPVSDEIGELIGDIDDTIRDIRNAIFGLRPRISSVTRPDCLRRPEPPRDR
jgi:PAS domain S-box-containing protein